MTVEFCDTNVVVYAYDTSAGLNHDRARQLLEYSGVVRPVEADVLAAIDATQHWQISFWDAMILTAAQRAGSPTVWSDDLTDGQTFDGVVVRNPFVST